MLADKAAEGAEGVAELSRAAAVDVSASIYDIVDVDVEEEVIAMLTPNCPVVPCPLLQAFLIGLAIAGPGRARRAAAASTVLRRGSAQQ